MTDDPIELPPLEPDDDAEAGAPTGKAGPPPLSPGRARELQALSAGPPPSRAAVPVPVEPRAPAAFLFDDLDDVPAPVLPAAPWWPLGWRIGVVYLVLYCLPFPLGLLAGGNTGIGGALAQAVQSWETHKQKTVVMFAELLGQPLTVFPNGSGDTTYNWFEVVAYALAAAFLGTLWHLLRRPRVPGARARDTARVYARYWLGATLLGYGLHKAIPLQFGELAPPQLLATYGESSPMNLLWTFMAASPAYTVFVGLAEVLAGLLLFWRRTALLGALVAVAVMSNVVMLNLCYDVPVKLFSAHLLAVACALLARDAGRLYALFVRNEPVAAAPLWPWSPSRLVRWPLLLVKLLLVCWLVWAPASGNVRAYLAEKALPPPSGTWEVETWSVDGSEVPPFAAPLRWRHLHIAAREVWPRVELRCTDGTDRSYALSVDAAAGTMTWDPVVAPGETAPASSTVAFRQPDRERLHLSGTVDGKRIEADCRRVDVAAFPLTSRGFHWVNEFPLNRRR